GFSAAITPRPSGPVQKPRLKGMPTGVFSCESGPPTRAAECQVSFWVENPLMPACASRLGREAGKPKQSGSMYSALLLPNSLRKTLVPESPWADGAPPGGRFPAPLSPRGPGGKPAPRRDILLQLAEVRRVVLLHHAITVRAGEIEDVVRVFLEQIKILV